MSLFGSASPATNSTVVVSRPKVRKGEAVKPSKISSTSIPKVTSSQAEKNGKAVASGTNGNGNGNDKAVKRNRSNNADDFFKDLEGTRRDLARVSDKVEYRQELERNAHAGPSRVRAASTSISAKGKEADSKRRKVEKEVGSSKNSNGNAKTTIPNSDSELDYGPSSPARTPVRPKHLAGRGLKPDRRRESHLSPISDDELSLGSTPSQHMTDGYREDKERQRRLRERSSSLKRAGSVSPTLVRKKHKARGESIPRSSQDRPSQQHRGGSGQSAKKGKAKGKERGTELVPASDEATPRLKSKSAAHQKVRERDDHSPATSHGSDPADHTPRPLARTRGASGSRGLNGGKRDSLNGGVAFFEELAKISSDLDGDLALLEEEDDFKFVEPEILADAGISEEDKKYLAPFRSKADFCPYCSEPLPTHPSAHLEQVQRDLEAVSRPCPTPTNPSARSLPWQQHIDFCSLHVAETGLIPLGVREGYPENISFLDLEKRLESGWIRARLDEIVTRPETSKIFADIKVEVDQVGKNRWGGLQFQSREKSITGVKPGYYGDLGRTIIINHFLQLRQWGHFPSLRSPESTSHTAAQHNPPSLQPLSWHDFVSHVLVPESAVLLIMDDQGATYSHDNVGAYERAEQVRAASAKYGTWRFREEGEEAEETLETLRQGREEKRRRLKLSAINGQAKGGATARKTGKKTADSRPRTREGSFTPKPVLTSHGRGKDNGNVSRSGQDDSAILVGSSPAKSVREVIPSSPLSNLPSPGSTLGPGPRSRSRSRSSSLMSVPSTDTDGEDVEVKPKARPVTSTKGKKKALAQAGSAISAKSSQSTQYGDEWDSGALNEAVALTDRVAQQGA